MRPAVLLVTFVALAACEHEPLAPGTGAISPAPVSSVVMRDDSVTNVVYTTWEEGTLTCWVWLNEAHMPGQPTQAWLSYSAFDMTSSTLVASGSGFIAGQDVLGSAQGFLRLRTNINATAYPDFVLYNHPGGAIEITWRAIPGTRERWHSVVTFPGTPILKINTSTTGQQATVEGHIGDTQIPSAATSWLSMNVSHTKVMQQGN